MATKTDAAEGKSDNPELRRELRKINARLDDLKGIIQSGTAERKELGKRKEVLRAQLAEK